MRSVPFPCPCAEGGEAAESLEGMLGKGSGDAQCQQDPFCFVHRHLKSVSSVGIERCEEQMD